MNLKKHVIASVAISSSCIADLHSSRLPRYARNDKTTILLSITAQTTPQNIYEKAGSSQCPYNS
jgi:uncharacterized protein (DUF4213/DUF364 family)